MAKAEPSRTLFTVRRLAASVTALLALGVVVGGVRLGADGYARWTPEREAMQPLAHFVAALVEGPRHVAGPESVAAAEIHGEGTAPAVPEATVPGPPVVSASTAPLTDASGTAPSPTIDLARSELAVAPTVDALDAISTTSDLPGSARSHERAPWSIRRPVPFEGFGLPTPTNGLSELGVEKIDEPADALSMDGARHR